MAPKFTICRHCRRGAVNRSRGLCWTCYHADGVRDLYPPDGKYVTQGHGINVFRPTTPEPTSAAPGTPEKQAVLKARAAAGQHLFHPEDARCPEDSERMLAGLPRLSGLEFLEHIGQPQPVATAAADDDQEG